MSKNLINVDRLTPMLLPVDMRDWIPTNHLVHFIIDAVNKLDLTAAKVNQRGTGSKQYPPSMMFALLIYSYITGTFSSRRIETLSYENVAVRYICADHHPDHDSICTFRRVNEVLFKSVFHQILELAARTKILKCGNLTISMDGSKIFANASKHSANSYDHVVEHIHLAQKEIEELMAKAEAADSTPLRDGLTIPAEITLREDRLARLTEAKNEMEARNKERFALETAEHEKKLSERKAKEEATGRKPRGCAPKAPVDNGPNAKDQYNYTDPDSRIMPYRGGFEQSYNAQIAVDVETMLIVGEHVCVAANDKEQLVPTLAAVSPSVGTVANILVDNGFYAENAIASVEASGTKPTVYAAVKRDHHGRTIKELEKHADPVAPAATASAAQRMKHRLETEAGRKLYGLRKQTVEPVFGIIKEIMGFRQFLLRGKEKVKIEWTLVTLSYNLKRLHRLGFKPSCV